MRAIPSYLRRLTLPVAIASLAACSPDDAPVRGEALAVSHASAHSNAIANVRAMMDAAWRTEKFLAESATLDRAAGVFEAFTGSDAEVDPDDEGGSPTGLVLPLDEVEFDDAKRSLQENLETYVFREDQIEARTATSITYRLRADRLCYNEDEDVVDEVCADAVEAVPLRVVATSLVEGDIDLTLLAGAERHDVASLELHADLIGFTINVGPVIETALDALAASDPEATPPTVITARGSVRGSLRRLSNDALRMSVEIMSPIEVEVRVDDEKIAFEAGSGFVALDADRGAGTAVLESDVRDLSVLVPQDFVRDQDACSDEFGEFDEALCPPLEGSATIELDRLAGIARLIDTAERGAFEGVIAGPFTIKLDDTKVFELTLNDETSPIDIDVTTTGDTLGFTVDGDVNLALLVELAQATDISESFADGWAASDFLRVLLPADTSKGRIADDAAVIDAGSIQLSSRTRPDLNRTFEAGECIGATLVDEEADEEPHPFEFTSVEQCFDANPPS